jgi:23S rRNA (adenine1618-N6)-methyltransferase
MVTCLYCLYFAKQNLLKMKKGQVKKEKVKQKLHKKNIHNDRYDLGLLTKVYPDLSAFIIKSFKGEDTVDFKEPKAVLALNKALLLAYYDIDHWTIPEGYLCPPVPGRADYIHHISDLLGGDNFGKVPKANVLDIGTGANLIYPIIGSKAYSWTYVGTDVDEAALENAQNIITQNERLVKQIELRQQRKKEQILAGVIDKKEYFDLVMSNPPFFASAQEAAASANRKIQNLHRAKREDLKQNFGGQQHELWYPGGERRFISSLINDSKSFAENCLWFTTLVSKSAHLKGFQDSLDYHKATEVRIINMGQGNKQSRILAWTFHDKDAQKEWRKTNWT